MISKYRMHRPYKSKGLKGCIEEGVASRDKRLVFMHEFPVGDSQEKRWPIDLGGCHDGGLTRMPDGRLAKLAWKKLDASFGNRQLLRKSLDNEKENRRRSVVLCFVWPIYGHPTTIEMLMLLGYVITGGLSCNELRSRDRKFPKGMAKNSHSINLYSAKAKAPMT